MKDMLEILMVIALIIIIMIGFSSVCYLFYDLILLFQKNTDINWQRIVLEIFGTSCLLYTSKNWHENK